MAMVCLCNSVSDRKLRRAIRHGASTIEQVGEACGAGTTCHGCHPTIESELDDAMSVQVRTAGIRPATV